MQNDFKVSLINFHLLQIADKKIIKANDFNNYFLSKALKDISSEDVARELSNLENAKCLRKISDDEFEITNQGRKEYLEIRRAIKKFFN